MKKRNMLCNAIEYGGLRTPSSHLRTDGAQCVRHFFFISELDFFTAVELPVWTEAKYKNFFFSKNCDRIGFWFGVKRISQKYKSMFLNENA